MRVTRKAAMEAALSRTDEYPFRFDASVFRIQPIGTVVGSWVDVVAYLYGVSYLSRPETAHETHVRTTLTEKHPDRWNVYFRLGHQDRTTGLTEHYRK